MQQAGRIPARSQDATPSPKLFAGTSGWAYASWKPGFYPKAIPSRAFLEHYASRLNSVEVNYTFRQLPSPAQLAGWLAAVPASFRFSFKAPQRITHMRRLRDCADNVQEFADAIEPARKANKLGVLLFQLPPNFKADADRLRAFLKLPIFKRRKLRIAFEFRHESWFSEETYSALRARDAALCIAEGDALVSPDVATASFRCYRLRKAGGYSSAQLSRLARKLRPSADTATALPETFVYFRHEDRPTGALNAQALLKKLAAPKEGR